MVEDVEGYLVADGFEKAFIGTATPFQTEGKEVAIYDARQCIELLMEDGCTYEEAVEFFEFNVSGAYVGSQTPIFLWTPENEE